MWHCYSAHVLLLEALGEAFQGSEDSLQIIGPDNLYFNEGAI